ncbi:MAG: formylglycine-generating enzyme family protein [Thermoguttaceae bacterium]
MQQRVSIMPWLPLALLVLLETGCIERRPASSPQPPAAPATTGDAAAPPSQTPKEIQTSGGAVMLLIPGGTFAMGREGQLDASPVHQVTVSPFYIDRNEVTQELYERLMGKNPSRRKGPQNPVERIRWTDTLKFCNARSAAEGLTPCYNLETWACDFSADGYRLPTEAEWEYACRAGSTGDYYFEGGDESLDAYGWFRDNAGRKHHPVGQKKPNALGLYDMAGNIREWCNDWYAVDAYTAEPATDPRGPATGEKTVLRGGAFSGSADTCTTWSRYCDEPGFTDACVASDDYGFRCVKRPPAPINP